MSTLHITLDSWQDLGQATATLPGGQPGDPLTGTVQIEAVGLDGWCIDSSGGLHTVGPFTDQVTPPWTVDLVDPTTCLRPSTDWGYRITLRASGAPPIFALLNAATIAAVAQIDGVRTISIESLR